MVNNDTFIEGACWESLKIIKWMPAAFFFLFCGMQEGNIVSQTDGLPWGGAISCWQWVGWKKGRQEVEFVSVRMECVYVASSDPYTMLSLPVMDVGNPPPLLHRVWQYNDNMIILILDIVTIYSVSTWAPTSYHDVRGTFVPAVLVPI